MSTSPADQEFAHELNTYSVTPSTFEAVLNTLETMTARLDQQAKTIDGIIDTNDRQDTALTELNGQVLDLQDIVSALRHRVEEIAVRVVRQQQ